ncbi:MAG: aspartate carbamoyltransferase catalytic subunit [Candidatus Omnitrophica bacterium]|nr:aspartate carbamoyltransferase catalytic subunit [Candidatus Omnitrophota bacterium]MCB9768193.1 aspartate carbamoyltransferase catalytic subunit [Candidatus Omnitrophota bacterium]
MERKDLLDIESLAVEEIHEILNTAAPFKEIFTRSVKRVPSLRGKTVVNVFFEPSTRTRTSFELAAKRLSADVVNISTDRSSLVKGESLVDTFDTLLAMKADLFVMRHSSAGAPHFIAERIPVPVLNAGDGAHSHPTQALLDAFTIREHHGRLEGLEVAIIGDITFSRVARSNIWALTKLGAKVRVSGPATLLPKGLERMGVTICRTVEEAIEGADVVYMLRIQKERQGSHLFPTIREYYQLFGLNAERLKLAKPDAIVMHPGPINRGVEISDDIADGPQSRIHDQVTNGVAVRMAVLFLLATQQKKPSLDEALAATE